MFLSLSIFCRVFCLALLFPLVLLALYMDVLLSQAAPLQLFQHSACAVRFDIGWASHFSLETLPSCPARLFIQYVMLSVPWKQQSPSPQHRSITMRK